MIIVQNSSDIDNIISTNVPRYSDLRAQGNQQRSLYMWLCCQELRKVIYILHISLRNFHVTGLSTKNVTLGLVLVKKQSYVRGFALEGQAIFKELRSLYSGAGVLSYRIIDRFGQNYPLYLLLDLSKNGCTNAHSGDTRLALWKVDSQAAVHRLTVKTIERGKSMSIP